MERHCDTCKHLDVEMWKQPCCNCDSPDFKLWESEEPEIDVVNHPSHYETGKFECIDVMQEVFGVDAVKDFCLCNAFKYLYRTKRKNGLEDIKKCQWYINKYIELEGDE